MPDVSGAHGHTRAFWLSGANALGGGITRALELFFGTDSVTFRLTSNHPLANPNVRFYERFSDAAADLVEVRIYQGIHFRTAELEGRKLGRKVARWAFTHYLRPLRGESPRPHDHEEHDE